MVGLALRDSLPRLLGLTALGALFLLAGGVSRVFLVGDEGRVEIGRLFLVGGYPLASGLLLLGWLLGRFPVIAALVLTAGIFSRDRERGWVRLVASRPVSIPAVYGLRLATLLSLAFVLSALVMPLFDLLMLGQWAGYATFVLIMANLAVYGGLTALLSVWFRADAWIALLLALAGLVFDAAVRADVGIPAGPRDVVGFLLPPQSAILRLEQAFGAVQPVPWDAFAYAVGYGVAAILLAYLSLRVREI